MTDHVTNWNTHTAAEEFARLDKELWWRLGYEPLPGALGVGSAEVRTVLDLGCGTGEVTNWVANSYAVDAIGVDPSASMLAEARRHAVPGTRYMQQSGDDDTTLATASVDAAWAAFVFVCLPDLPAMQRLADELARVVRPGGRVAVLDSHPDTTGCDFADLMQGEPGVTYHDGDPLPVWLRYAEGGWDQFVDTYWSGETYTSVLHKAGFDEIEHHAPTLDLDSVPLQQRNRWNAAARQPPFLRITARRREPQPSE